MNIFFLMNGNIFNYSLASEQYTWNCGFWCDSAYAIPPTPPGNISTITGEPIFVQSYINAYDTAFNQETSSFSGNYQMALNEYRYFTPDYVNAFFVPGTFGYAEEYSSNSGESLRVKYLVDSSSNYMGIPCLFRQVLEEGRDLCI
ncbi:MAG: hypothetical protein RXN93_08950 [Thermocladium sp.]